jgi:hypothetical protein
MDVRDVGAAPHFGHQVADAAIGVRATLATEDATAWRLGHWSDRPQGGARLSVERHAAMLVALADHVHPAARRLDDLAGGHREGDRERDRNGRLRERTG